MRVVKSLRAMSLTVAALRSCGPAWRVRRSFAGACGGRMNRAATDARRAAKFAAGGRDSDSSLLYAGPEQAQARGVPECALPEGLAAQRPVRGVKAICLLAFGFDPLHQRAKAGM